MTYKIHPGNVHLFVFSPLLWGGEDFYCNQIICSITQKDNLNKPCKKQKIRACLKNTQFQKINVCLPPLVSKKQQVSFLFAYSSFIIPKPSVLSPIHVTPEQIKYNYMMEVMENNTHTRHKIKNNIPKLILLTKRKQHWEEYILNLYGQKEKYRETRKDSCLAASLQQLFL